MKRQGNYLLSSGQSWIWKIDSFPAELTIHSPPLIVMWVCPTVSPSRFLRLATRSSGMFHSLPRDWPTFILGRTLVGAPRKGSTGPTKFWPLVSSVRLRRRKTRQRIIHPVTRPRSLLFLLSDSLSPNARFFPFRFSLPLWILPDILPLVIRSVIWG